MLHRHRSLPYVLLRKSLSDVRTAGRVVVPFVGDADAALEHFVVVVARPPESDGQRAHDVFGRQSDQFKILGVCTARVWQINRVTNSVVAKNACAALAKGHI